MGGFGTGLCGICGKRIRWDDDFCSDLCEQEAERRGEAAAALPPEREPGHEQIGDINFPSTAP